MKKLFLALSILASTVGISRADLIGGTFPPGSGSGGSSSGVTLSSFSATDPIIYYSSNGVFAFNSSEYIQNTNSLQAGASIYTLIGQFQNGIYNSYIPTGSVLIESGTLIAGDSSYFNYDYTGHFLYLGNSTSTVVGNHPYVVMSASGTSSALEVDMYGNVSGGSQNGVGGITTKSMTIAGPANSHIVSVDSTTDNQGGYGIWEIWEHNPNHNDPLIWIHNDGQASNPFMRVDDLAPDMELVNLSTDNVHGLGKFEPMAIAYQGIYLQVNSRSWDNSTFENLAQWWPLSQGGGLELQNQTLTFDTNLTSSDTTPIRYDTLNGHTVGLTGPNSPTASWNFGLPSTANNQGQVLYQKDNGRGGNLNARSWEFTTGGVGGQGWLLNNGTGAPTWTNTISSNVIVNNTFGYLAVTNAAGQTAGFVAQAPSAAGNNFTRATNMSNLAWVNGSSWTTNNNFGTDYAGWLYRNGGDMALVGTNAIATNTGYTDAQVMANTHIYVTGPAGLTGIGMGSTIPTRAQFQVMGATTTANVVGFTTSTAGPFTLYVSSMGAGSVGYEDKTSSPVVTSCGTSPIITGTNNAFQVTGGGTATGCVITFTPGTFVKKPHCTFSEQTPSLTNLTTYSYTAAAVTISETGFAGNIVDVACTGAD